MSNVRRRSCNTSSPDRAGDKCVLLLPPEERCRRLGLLGVAGCTPDLDVVDPDEDVRESASSRESRRFITDSSFASLLRTFHNQKVLNTTARRIWQQVPTPCTVSILWFSIAAVTSCMYSLCQALLCVDEDVGRSCQSCSAACRTKVVAQKGGLSEGQSHQCS